MKLNWPATYFYLQGALGVAWWLFIFLSPTVRSWFLPKSFPDTVLLSLVLADMTFVLGSLFAGWLIGSKRKSKQFCCLVAGATVYATLTCWGWTLFSGEAVAGSIAMTLALLGTAWATFRSEP